MAQNPVTIDNSSGEHNDVDLELFPFSSRIIALEFDAGHTLNIHRAVIPDDSELSAHCDESDVLRLGHISNGVGHVLVHYLYTQQYQELSMADTALNQLRTAMQVYAAARSYRLQGLEELAREKITLLSEDFNVFDIIDVAREEYPSPVGDDVWFSQYVKSSMKAALRTLPVQAMGHVPADLSDGVVIAKLLLQAFLEVSREILELADGVAGPGEPRECAFGTEQAVEEESAGNAAAGESQGPGKATKTGKKVSFDDAVQCMPSKPEITPEPSHEPAIPVENSYQAQKPAGKSAVGPEDAPVVSASIVMIEGIRGAAGDVCDIPADTTRSDDKAVTKPVKSAGLSIDTKEQEDKLVAISDTGPDLRLLEALGEPELAPMTPDSIQDFFTRLMTHRIVAEPECVQDPGRGSSPEMGALTAATEEPVHEGWVGLDLGQKPEAAAGDVSGAVLKSPDEGVSWSMPIRRGRGKKDCKEKRKPLTLKPEPALTEPPVSGSDWSPQEDPWAFWGAKKSPRLSL